MKKIILILVVLTILVINLFADETVTCKFLARGRNMNIDYTLKCFDGYINYLYYSGNNISINTTTLTSVDVDIEDGYSPVLLEAVESSTTYPVFQMTTFNPLPLGGWVSNILEVNANAVYLRLQAIDVDMTVSYILHCSDYSTYSDYNIGITTSNIRLIHIPINVNTYPTFLEVDGTSYCGHPYSSTTQFEFGEVPEFTGGFEYWWNGYFSNNAWQPLYVQGYPYINAIANIYSNIEIENAEITYSYEVPLRNEVTIIQDLKKGWNPITFNNVCLCEAEVEATAVGVGGEDDTIITTNDFIYNPETGYYENSDIEFCFENKPLHDDWNWESLPKLPVNGTINNDDTNMVPLLQYFIIPGGYTWLDVEGRDDDLEYRYQETPPWTPDPYLICSSDGFKIQIQEPERVYVANGTRVLETTTINLQVGWNWIGYWLPHSEMTNVAFGDDWSKVKEMASEDWYYYNKTPIRGINDPVSWTPKPLHYGEGYMVYLSESIDDFHWQTSTENSKNFNKPESENFNYEKKADYEVIDVVNIDPSISEIGVFADGVCLGAVVVQDSSEQILVYSENANRDPVPFDFEIITGRGSSFPIKNYEVYNFETSEFENDLIISGHQNYSLIMLGEEGEQEEDLPIITKLHSNYPNPFNPTTTISFSVTQNFDFVNLEIFNVKGQKVKTLFNGSAEEGKHTVTWNGDDENDNPVSSGIYFYKLNTGEQELSRKMLLLK